MNKIFKCLIRFLIEVIVMTVLLVGINIFMNGMYLWGLPRINDIQSVNITYPSVTDDVKEISSREDIELALKPVSYTHLDVYKRQMMRQSSLWWTATCSGRISCPARERFPTR